MLSGGFVAVMALATTMLLPTSCAANKESPRKYFEQAGYLKCPEACDVTGPDRANWTTFSNLDVFLSCSRKPKLFDLAVHALPADAPGASTLIRTCASVANEFRVRQQSSALAVGPNNDTVTVLSDEVRSFRDSHACAANSALETVQEPQIGRSVAPAALARTKKKKSMRGQILGATRAIQSELLRSGGCDASSASKTILFSHYGKTTVGLYSGARIQDQRLATSAIEKFLQYVRDDNAGDVPSRLVMQLCGDEHRTSSMVFGIIVETTPGAAGIANVQRAVAGWSNATCVDGFDETVSAGNVTLAVTKSEHYSGSSPSSSSSSSSIEARDLHPRHALEIRAECRTTEVLAGEGCWAVANRCGITQDKLIEYNGGSSTFCSTLMVSQVVCCSAGDLPDTGRPPNPDGTCATVQVESGDSCGSLASECGIPGPKFEEYNKDTPNFCSTLAVGQYVCCSEGELPDMKPKPNPDGSCFTYTVGDGEWCAMIAAANGLTVNDIEDFNRDTWGFASCDNLPKEAKICLSTGSPPMPEPISNAVCGPQVPGTAAPSDRSRKALAKLNPCPLNVCCNGWGQCGTTQLFCNIPDDTPLGGSGGCISNCGTEIVNNDQGPAEFRKIAYFEAFNGNRKCLYMDVEDVDRSKYTHLHFSFVDLTPEFGVSTANVQDQFDRLLKLDGIKRIAAFGGWAASTEPSTFWVFREGVKPGNREILATNLANFILEHDLEGIDMDWEYPAAPDIPGIPPADPMDGGHYLEFLKLLRAKLPNKSVAIAAPASYWYLRGFPIDEIAEIVDYIVFMTYDLHGQWDYNNPWSQDGCPEGNCLRSHINMTETMAALTMITKAGVPSHKITVGISSYGRSFKAAEPGCTGPMCRYLGEASQAAPGRCTDEAGYVSNAEINDIMKEAGASSETIEEAFGANNSRNSLSVRAGTDWFRDDTESDIIVYDSTEWAAFMNEQNKLSRTYKWQGLNFGGVSDWAVDLQRFSVAEGGGGPGDPGPIGEGAWKSVPCTVEAVKNVTMDPRKRWEGVGADQAWKEIVKAWENRDKGEWEGFQFPTFVSAFLNGVEGMKCGIVKGENGCTDKYVCNDFEPNEDSGPAAYFILNSIVHLSGFFWNNYQGTINAASSMDSLKFAKDFGHDDKRDDTLLLFSIINALTVGFTVGLAGIFNNAMKGVIKGSVKDNLKDTSYVMVSVGATQTKDMISGLKLPEDINLYVEVMLNEAVDHLQDAIVALGEGAFNGDAASIEFLTKMLADGKLIMPPGDQAANELRDRWKGAIYGSSIAHAWQMVGITPVIVDADADCDEEGVGVDEYISSETAEVARGCVDDKLYYLLDPDGNPVWGGDHLFDSDFSLPNGLKTVANDEWVGVTVEDLIYSAVKWTKEHGNRKNVEDGPEATFDDSWDQLWDVIEGNMVRVPGVVDIPVCSVSEARENWKQHFWDDTPRYYEYPCNGSGN